ncbi:MAG: hydroxyphenylacetyl-CoA thioesterase PaaI [Vicinamibacterales bacterium]
MTAPRDPRDAAAQSAAVAAQSAAAMWDADRASQHLGMRIEEVGPGRAVLSMTIGETMVNGHGIAHGGYVFTLADSAFAFACNSHGHHAVAAQCQIAYLKPGRLGDHLVATAREVAREGRSGIYDVRVTRGHEVIAEFRGHSRQLAGSWVEPDRRQP